MGNFVECVKSRKPTICPAEVGHQLGLHVSSGRDLDSAGPQAAMGPGEEEYVGDAEANTYRAREMRKPYDYTMV